MCEYKYTHTHIYIYMHYKGFPCGQNLFAKVAGFFARFITRCFVDRLKSDTKACAARSSSPSAIVHRFVGLFMAGHFSDKSVIFLEAGCSSWKVKRDGRTSFQLDAICCLLLRLRSPRTTARRCPRVDLWILIYYLIYNAAYV